MSRLPCFGRSSFKELLLNFELLLRQKLFWPGSVGFVETHFIDSNLNFWMKSKVLKNVSSKTFFSIVFTNFNRDVAFVYQRHSGNAHPNQASVFVYIGPGRWVERHSCPLRDFSLLLEHALKSVISFVVQRSKSITCCQSILTLVGFY